MAFVDTQYVAAVREAETLNTGLAHAFLRLYRFHQHMEDMREMHGYDSWATALVTVDRLRADLEKGLSVHEAKQVCQMLKNWETDDSGEARGASQEERDIYSKLKLIAAGDPQACFKIKGLPRGIFCKLPLGHTGDCQIGVKE